MLYNTKEIRQRREIVQYAPEDSYAYYLINVISSPFFHQTRLVAQEKNLFHTRTSIETGICTSKPKGFIIAMSQTETYVSYLRINNQHLFSFRLSIVWTAMGPGCWVCLRMRDEVAEITHVHLRYELPALATSTIPRRCYTNIGRDGIFFSRLVVVA